MATVPQSVSDRLRALFLPVGYPGLDLSQRPGAWSVAMIQQRLSEALATTTLDARRRDILFGLCLLWHDHWDAAHQVCQAHEGDPDHDYVHAVLHRREGDDANCRYWLAQVGEHPVYRHLLAVVAAEGLTALVDQGLFCPERFLALRQSNDATQRPALIRIQAAELLTLLELVVTPGAG